MSAGRQRRHRECDQRAFVAFEQHETGGEEEGRDLKVHGQNGRHPHRRL
jgi:hypothetical protein